MDGLVSSLSFSLLNLSKRIVVLQDYECTPRASLALIYSRLFLHVANVLMISDPAMVYGLVL